LSKRTLHRVASPLHPRPCDTRQFIQSQAGLALRFPVSYNVNVGKDYRNFPVALIPRAINTNFHVQKCIAMFLRFNDAPALARAALRDSYFILDDTVLLLEGLLEGVPKTQMGSRLPRGFSEKPTVEELVDTMQTSIDLLAIETEIILKKSLEISDEEYSRQSERTHDLIRIMGSFAHYLKSAVQSRDPEAWTEELERRFEKFLKIRP